MRKRSQETKFPSCYAHLMCVNFFSKGPYYGLPFGVCSALNILSSWDSGPSWLLYSHSPNLTWRGKGFSQLPACLKEGLKRKKKAHWTGLGKSLHFILFSQIFKGLDVEKHQNSENTYSLSRFLQRFFTIKT